MVALAVFDIDGVVADVRHRLHHLERRPQRWGAFFSAADRDELLAEGAAAVQAQQSAGHDIVWLTGRPEWLRSVTTDWLSEQGLPTAALFMRPDHDYRPARLFKVETLRSFEQVAELVVFVDDDPDVVVAARAAGFPVTLAAWVPHSKTLNAAQEQAGRT